MTVIVNDANILIDLVKLNLLPQFFDLGLDFNTTPFILEELHPEQLQQVNEYIVTGILKVVDLTDEELIDIALLQAQKTQLSTQDCSTIVCAQKIKGELLTSDNNLRKFAASKQLTVRGHLWVFDQLVAECKITGATAILKLKELRETINPRLGLPKHECDARIELWSSL
jgi:predicted nucleic acid-binding protein